MKTTPSASSLMSRENLYFLVLAALLLLVFPVLLDAFRLNLVGKYLTYALVAVGGRHSLLGAVYGALLVNAAKTGFSESFPELWLYAMGALFIAVVLAFPNGIAGLYQRYLMPLEKKILGGLGKAANTPPTAATRRMEETP